MPDIRLTLTLALYVRALFIKCTNSHTSYSANNHIDSWLGEGENSLKFNLYFFRKMYIMYGMMKSKVIFRESMDMVMGMMMAMSTFNFAAG